MRVYRMIVYWTAHSLAYEFLNAWKMYAGQLESADLNNIIR